MRPVFILFDDRTDPPDTVAVFSSRDKAEDCAELFSQRRQRKLRVSMFFENLLPPEVEGKKTRTGAGHANR